MKLKYRTVFISDAHLGSKGARAKDLSRFLRNVRCERLYLVGDIIDMWRLKQRWYWPKKHNDVVRRILKHVKRGTEVIFIPGNHDEGARQFLELNFGGVQVAHHAQHETADGKVLFVCHGDEFDLVVRHSRLLAMCGGMAYDWLVVVNRYYNLVRRLLGMKYWSLSQAVKMNVKHACSFISQFEEALIKEAEQRGLDGVVCGHIHKAEIRTTASGIEYYNCGDWVESCTALVEHFNGKLEVIDGIKSMEELIAARREKKAAKQVTKELHQDAKQTEDVPHPDPSYALT